MKTDQKAPIARGRRLLPAIILLASSFAGHARSPGEDWTQFRGPNGTGVSNTANLPTEFGPDKNVIWKAATPAGHSSPVLGRENVYMTGFEGNKLFTVAIDKRTGKLLWRQEVPRDRTNHLLKPNNPASPSPVTDGENVYAFFMDFGLISYGPTGKERWRMPLGPFNSVFGLAASPILAGDKLILACDQNDNSYLLAVDKNSGRLRWKTARPEVISGYSTPVLYRPKDGPAQVLVAEAFKLSAYSVETGERVWWVRGLACEMKSIPVLVLFFV
jgi:outer membrane protein assembly factor BamB